MGLLDRTAQYDSIQELDCARLDRYWDGLACALDHREFGACYLFGYVVEMSLKVAYYRYRGARAWDDLTKERLAALQMARQRNAGNLHNVRFWARILIEERFHSGRPLDPAFAAELTAVAAGVADNWSEILRYRRSVPATDECAELHRAAEWTINNHHRLWS